MDEPRTGRSMRRLALLLSVPVAAVAMWVSVAAAGGSGSPERVRSDVAKPKPAKVQKQQHAGRVFSQHGKRNCPYDDAGLTSADV
jgi:hypothetical protein